MGATSVHSLPGVQETVHFPLPKGLGDKSMREVAEDFRTLDYAVYSDMLNALGAHDARDLLPALEKGRLHGGALTELGVADRGAHVPGGLLGRFQPSVNVGSQKMDAAIDARMINTTTGEIVWADSAKESTSDAKVYVAGAGGGVDDKRKLDRVLRPVVVKLAESMGKASPPTWGLGGSSHASGVAGKVAKVEGGTIFLNVGSEAGIKEGSTFDVYRVGNVIKDPDTGEVLGANEVKVGRVRITNVMPTAMIVTRVVCRPMLAKFALPTVPMRENEANGTLKST